MQPAEIVKTTMPLPPDIPKDAKLLEIRAKCVYEDDQLLDHLKSAVARDIPHFSPSPQNDHEIALIGSAPSIKGQVETIRKLRSDGVYIMAIKAAHDFLIEHDIIPHLAIMVDPQPHIIKCFKHKHPEVFYLIASQCNPEVFDYFKDCKSVLWHLLTGKEGEKEVFNGEIALGGGSTSGMRAMTLAWAMGFRKFHMFGYDSSLSDKELKIDGTTFEHEPMVLWIDGKQFLTNPAMAAQTTEFEKVMNSFKGQIQVRLYGEGAIPWVADRRYRRGLPDVTESEFRPIVVHKDYWTI